MDDYARLAKEQQQLELENLVRSRNDITIHVDATRVFEHYQPPPISPFGRASAKKQRTPTVIDSLERTEISQLYMKNSFLVRRQHTDLDGSFGETMSRVEADINNCNSPFLCNRPSLDLGHS